MQWYAALIVDKLIKLWKVNERMIKIPNDDEEFDGVGVVKLPTFRVDESVTVATPKRLYANAHAYHINSLSLNSDGETYISADDLRINLWNLEYEDQSFSKSVLTIDIVDIKPDSMEELTEVITAAEFHPIECNLLMYSTSKGNIRLADMRTRALCDSSIQGIQPLTIVFEDSTEDNNKTFFSEIISSISDIKFSKDGSQIISRDYLTVKVWDPKMPNKPLSVFPVHDHLKPKLCDLYENDCLFDKFEVNVSYDSSFAISGSYSNYLQVFDIKGKTNPVFLHADKNAFKSKKPTKPKFIGRKKKDDFATNVDFSKKILHSSWHPEENSIAVAATNNLFIFSQL